MYKVGVCGNFGSQQNISNGQVVKTRVVSEELKKSFGDKNIYILNTFGWRNNPFKLFINCITLALSCSNILILPAQNGIRIFVPLFTILCKLFKRKLHYSVIGGWLPEFLQENQRILKHLKKFEAIYVETKTMEQKLINLDLNNIVYMPNFKSIKPISASSMPKYYIKPYPLCTFSRVIEEKGILDAITAVKRFNEKVGEIAFKLDIYGTVEPDFEVEFNDAISNSLECVEYKGVIAPDKSTEKLKNYFALIFPTYYIGEGFPGTIIDAYSSGVPVIATDWRYNSEIVHNGKTGFIYKLNQKKETGLIGVLEEIYNKPEELIAMKNNCLNESKKYDATVVMEKMICRMEEL